MRSSKGSVILTLLYTVSVLKGQLCPSQNVDIQRDLVVYETVRYGHYIELDCCSQSTVRWMKLNKDTGKWQGIIPDRDDVRLLESNQILTIQSAMFEDTGSYKCLQQNGSSTTDLKEFKVNVIACDKLARGPYPVFPLPCTETFTREKEMITLPCTGYFGCGEEGDVRIAMWYVTNDDSDNWKLVSEVDKRYTETKFEQDSGTVVGSNLTIVDVSSVDFNRKFMCLLATPQTIKGQTSIVVTLKKSSKMDEDSVLLSGFNTGEVVIVLTAVTVILIIVTVVSVGFCLHMKIFNKQKVVRRGDEEQWMTMTFKDKESPQTLP